MSLDLADAVVAEINASPTPYHAVARLAAQLEHHGFTPLAEEEPSWSLRPGGRHYVVRERGSLIAFMLPSAGLHAPLRMVSAHTDSPVLKLKPHPLKRKRDHLVFDIEVYGGAIQASWFDRDLSLAGLVTLQDPEFGLHPRLLDWRMPLARVPHLAIHLNRGINDGFKANPQEEMTPILGEAGEEKPQEAFFALVREQLLRQGEAVEGGIPLAWDLMFYDTQPVARVGLAGEWIAGARLDNLLSCFVGAEGLVRHGEAQADGGEGVAMLACFNHEEVGNLSTTGAAGNFAESVLARLYPEGEARQAWMRRSWHLSLDNAHGCHPNYPAQQDENHCPRLNRGVVIKHNANQRYATSAVSGGWVKGICRRLEVPWQEFSARADTPCGSTVGPTLAARLGLSTADVGLPTWAMHSLRETAGSRDLESMARVLTGFFAAV